MLYRYHRIDKTSSIDFHAHVYTILESTDSRLVDLLSAHLILMSSFLCCSNEISLSETDHY
jgi:hypothetical protein